MADHLHPDWLVRQLAEAMMDKVGEHDRPEDVHLWTATSQSEEDETIGDPAWLFAAVLVIVVLGLWAANSPQFESLITSLAWGGPS